MHLKITFKLMSVHIVDIFLPCIPTGVYKMAIIPPATARITIVSVIIDGLCHIVLLSSFFAW